MKLKRFLPHTTTGSLTVEATIVLTLMIFFMLFLMSFARIVQVESIVAHSLIQSSQSLAVESYGINKLKSDILADAVLKLCDLFDGSSAANGGNFARTDSWFGSDGKSLDVDAVKERVSAYIGGSTSTTNTVLKELGVKDGMSGLDFGESKIEGKDLKINVSYRINLMIHFPGIEYLEVKQGVTARMWK